MACKVTDFERIEPLTDYKRALEYSRQFERASEGSRNKAAFSNAARLREKFNLLPDEILDIITAWNAHNQPPLPEAELRSVVYNSIEKYARKPAASGRTEPKKKQKHEPQQARKGDLADFDRLIEDSISGVRNNVYTPWRQLDFLTMWLLSGTTTIYCGGIGASKTFAMLQLLLFILHQGIKCAALFLEENVPYYQNRLLAQLSATPDIINPIWQAQNPKLTRSLYSEHRGVIETAGSAMYDFSHTQPTQNDVINWMQQRAAQQDRVLIVDPMTAASRDAEPWIADDQFVQAAKRICSESGISLILVTHPIKGSLSVPSLDSLAGSTAFARFSQSGLWLESHEPKTSSFMTDCGTIEKSHNRTLHILKARNGRGTGLKIAMHLSGENLTLNELGIITKKKKRKKSEEQI